MNGDDLQTCDPGRRAEVAADAITLDRIRWHKANRRPPALSAREALVALHFEALVVWTAAQNLAAEVDLSEDDRARLTLAASRVLSICDEVIR